MTTIRDMLLASLREIGADGVAEVRANGATLTFGPCEIDSGERWPLPSDRPAFLDASGRLVPLPEGLAIVDKSLRHRSGLSIYRGGKGFMFSRYAGGVESYQTAPEAWAAAEAWLKEQEVPE